MGIGIGTYGLLLDGRVLLEDILTGMLIELVIPFCFRERDFSR